MQTAQTLYTYHIVEKGQTELLSKTAECLAQSFFGIEVSGKWVQEPMVGQLNFEYEDLYDFIHDYLNSVADQGYCAIALDQHKQVVGALVGDTNAPQIIGEDIFEGTFSDMNILLGVLEDVDKRFMEDFHNRHGREIEDGELLHLFMLGVRAEHGRHEIIQQLGSMLMTKGKEEGLKFVLGEATNPKSIRVMEKYHDMTRYIDRQGSYIVYKYKENDRLKGIPSEIADGTYILVKDLS